MSILWIFLPAAIACGILEGRTRGKALREADEAKEKEIQAEIEAEMEAEAASQRAADVWDALMSVYTKLRQAGAWIHRPWIRGCMEEIRAGRECPPDIAIMALIKTGDDLAGSRWDTDEMAETFGQAAEKLAAMI